MKRHSLVIGVACALAAPAFAQAPPQTEPPVTPKAEQNRPDKCAQTTIGQGNDIDAKKPAQGKNLSDKLAASNGVICPPPHVDPAMKQPAPPGGTMPVIPRRRARRAAIRRFSRKSALLDRLSSASLYPPIPGPQAGFGGGVAQLVRAAES